LPSIEISNGGIDVLIANRTELMRLTEKHEFALKKRVKGRTRDTALCSRRQFFFYLWRDRAMIVNLFNS